MRPEYATEIESVQFSVELNIASSTSLFFRVLEDQTAFKRLCEDTRKNGFKWLVERIETLIADTGDGNFEHPHDAAIAAYLWALFKVDLVQVLKLSALINETPRLSWTRVVFQAVVRNVQPCVS